MSGTVAAVPTADAQRRNAGARDAPDPHDREGSPMPRIGALVLCVLMVTGCATSGASQAPAASSPPAVAPAGSTGCIDRADLGDTAESVVNALSGLDTAMKASNASQAATSAKTASTGLRALAALVATAAPDAQKLFASAADSLDAAIPKLPNAAPEIAQASTAFYQALPLAQAKGC
jgi:hypothetical protein